MIHFGERTRRIETTCASVVDAGRMSSAQVVRNRTLCSGATQLGPDPSAVTTLAAPDGLPTAPGSYVAVEITADGTEHESWRVPVTAYFRRQADGWKLVGLERLPEERPGRVAAPR